MKQPDLTNIKNIIFDLGNVLYDIRYENIADVFRTYGITDFEEKYGKHDSSERIVAVTDQARGALKGLATQEGYTTFVIPDDVGGRYSVLTPVGLLPIALAGFDIKSMLKGASDMKKICYQKSDDNPAVEYASVRNALYSKGWKIEILVNYNPKLQYFAEWWKQLIGVS